MTFIDDSLLTRASGITYHGQAPDVDEELSPTLENLFCLHGFSLFIQLFLVSTNKRMLQNFVAAH